MVLQRKFMKKTLIAAVTTGLVLFGAGCGNDEKAAATEPAQVQSKAQPVEQTSKYPFPNNAKETGKGKVSVQTASGDSATGITPVEFIGKDIAMTQIGITLENFDGAKEVFIYVNGKYLQTEQAGEMFQGTMTLEGDLLKPGVYTVAAVQFENNDPKNGKVTEFHTAKYEVKAKSE